MEVGIYNYIVGFYHLLFFKVTSHDFVYSCYVAINFDAITHFCWMLIYVFLICDLGCIFVAINVSRHKVTAAITTIDRKAKFSENLASV
jgi:hypothetical protein